MKNMEVQPSLKTVLKRLRLSGIMLTLVDRCAYAQKAKLAFPDFLELVLQDEIDRRDQVGLDLRLRRAQFEEQQTFEGFDWDAPVTFDRDRVRDLFGLGFLERHEDAIFMGPAGVGKTFLASALGHAACRANKRVLFTRADTMLAELHQSRADNSTQKVLRGYLGLDLLIIDDFGLRKLTGTGSSDLYEVLVGRHKRASTVVTSNRTVDEWVPLFDDPILAQSALDRLAHNAHQVVMEGDSYRKRQGPAGRNRSAEPARSRRPAKTRRKAVA
jgi:DNA replication protein DnaC